MSVSTKTPQTVFDTVFAFPPNRETLGGTAYLILEQSDGKTANILVDCPALSEANQEFIEAKGGIQTLFITHRGGMAEVPKFQSIFSAQVLIQQEEAYLLPTVETETFERDRILTPTSKVFWNTGHSPGSACLYHAQYGGILFTGRHLLPDRDGNPRPLRQSKTFHWPRQLRHAQQLLSDFTPETLSYICPGGSTGFLRGGKKIDNAYKKLQSTNWDELAAAEPKM